MSTIDLTGLPDDPVVNLDDWISSRLPINDAKSFYSEVMALEPNHCRGEHETTFVYGVQAAAYGNHEYLSFFLSQDGHFNALSKPKRDLIAWIMCNPQNPKLKNYISRNRMRSMVQLVATLVEWCSYTKTKAIETAVHNLLYGAGIDQSQAAEDLRLQRKESLRAQLFKALRSGGELSEYYEKCALEMREHTKAMNELRVKESK